MQLSLINDYADTLIQRKSTSFVYVQQLLIRIERLLSVETLIGLSKADKLVSDNYFFLTSHCLLSITKTFCFYLRCTICGKNLFSTTLKGTVLASAPEKITF